MGWAAYRGHLDVVKLLIEYGVQLNPDPPLGKKRGSGTTPLILAAYGGQLEMVRFLVENGADIHIQNGHNYIVLCGRIQLYCGPLWL